MTDAVRFEQIYREYRPKVLDYIRSHVNSPEDAEDLCSEVFRKALEHLDPTAGTAVSSYLYTITRRTVVDYYRTHRLTAPLDEACRRPARTERKGANDHSASLQRRRLAQGDLPKNGASLRGGQARSSVGAGKASARAGASRRLSRRRQRRM